MDGLSLLITGDVKMYNAHEHRLPQLCDMIWTQGYKGDNKMPQLPRKSPIKFSSTQCQQHNVIL